MKINKRDFNLGRCMRITLRNPVTGLNFVIEHAPDIDRDKYIAMDVSVKDLPSSRAKDNPGFTALIKIFNPSKELLGIISAGTTWLVNYRNDPNEEEMKIIRERESDNFYNSRVYATVEAGYVNNGVPDYHVVIQGYVNGSSFSHKGTDDVLIIGVYDIDLSASALDEITDPSKLTTDDFLSWAKNGAFEDTWYNTLHKFIRSFERDRIATSSDTRSSIRDIRVKIAGKNFQNNAPMAEESVQMTFASNPPVRLTDADRNFGNWYDVQIVTSWADYLASKNPAEAGTRTRRFTNVDLEVKLKNFRMPLGYGVSATNLAQALNSLCAVYGGIGWKKDTDRVTRNTYVIFPLGGFKIVTDPVELDKKAIKIYNYQNLLESPSVSGNGALTIKMLYHPQVRPLGLIELVLDPNIKTDVTRDISKLDNGLIGSMSYQSSNMATVPSIQINGAQVVAALEKENEVKENVGFLFNKGFTITSVEHSLSTYGKDWTTIVHTAPVPGGL